MADPAQRWKLYVSNRLSITMAILLFAAITHENAESQTFVRHPRWISVGPNPCAIVAPDLNGDGIPDIVTADRGIMRSPYEEKPANDELSVRIGQKDLAFEPLPPLRAGFAPWCIAVANMDNRKALDLVVGNFHAQIRQLSLFLNLGDNLFEAVHFDVAPSLVTYRRMLDADERPVFAVPGFTSVTIGDFNQDSYRDVVAAGWSSDVLVFFPGDANRYLGPPKIIPAAGAPYDVQSADLDGDGKLELVTTHYVTNEIAIWKIDSSGDFTEQTRFLSRGKLPHRVRVADVNGDGVKDLVVSHVHADDSIVLFYGEKGAFYPVAQELMLGRDRQRIEHEIRDVLVQDFTGDGRPEIVAACAVSRQVVVFVNAGNDSRVPVTFTEERYTFQQPAGSPRALCSADFNTDGKPDLAVAIWEANAVALLLKK